MVEVLLLVEEGLVVSVYVGDRELPNSQWSVFKYVLQFSG